MNDVTLHTWDDLYKLAMDCGFGDDALNAKDNARHQFGNLVSDIIGFDIESEECTEEVIDFLLDKNGQVMFDIAGNIVEEASGTAEFKRNLLKNRSKEVSTNDER